jgi:hypothetical protein
MKNLSQITDSINNLFKLTLSEKQIKCALTSYFFAYNINSEEVFQLTNKLKVEIANFKLYLNVPIKNCIKCNKQLQNSKEYEATIFFIDGPKLSSIISAQCEPCNILFTLDYYIEQNKKFHYSNDIKTEYIMTSGKTGFHSKLFEQCNEYLLRNGFSFSAFSDSYNQLFPKNGLRTLIRQRMVECWFRSKILEFEHQTSDKEIPYIEAKLTENYLKENFEKYKCHFIKKWTSLHQSICKKNFCKETSRLILLI